MMKIPSLHHCSKCSGVCFIEHKVEHISSVVEVWSDGITLLSVYCLDLEKFGFNFTDLISGFGIRSQSGSYAFTGARET